MADNPHLVLRLNTCPKCKYDLSGLPAAHTCPECGLVYSDDFFDVRGCSWRNRKGFSFIKLSIINGICIAIVFAFWWFGMLNNTDVIRPLLGFVFLNCMILYMRYEFQKSPPVQKTFTTEGMLVLRENNLVLSDWCEVKHFSITKSHRGHWRLKIQQRKLSFRQSFKKQGVFARADMKLDCTDDEAEAIRSEINRRLKNAHNK